MMTVAISTLAIIEAKRVKGETHFLTGTIHD